MQVLFRSGVLNQLEAKRDELLSDRIIQMQAYCRGYLARRRVGQRRVQVSEKIFRNEDFLIKFFSHRNWQFDAYNEMSVRLCKSAIGHGGVYWFV